MQLFGVDYEELPELSWAADLERRAEEAEIRESDRIQWLYWLDREES